MLKSVFLSLVIGISYVRPWAPDTYQLPCGSCYRSTASSTTTFMELATTFQRGGEGAGGGEDEQPRGPIAIFDPAPGSEIAHHPSSAALDDHEGADGEDKEYGDDDDTEGEDGEKSKKVAFAAHQASMESGGADQDEAGAADESGLLGWNTTFE